MSNIKLPGKILIALLFSALIFYGLKFMKSSGVSGGFLDSVLPSGKSVPKVDLSELGVPEETKVLRVGVVTWSGYAAGEYFNEGFKPTKNSRFYKDYGFLVQFLILDDFQTSRDAWKAGKVDLLWATADAFPTESDALSEYDPKIILQADWSRGGDAIVVTSRVKSIADLKGKKVAVAFATPSHSFLINALAASGLNYDDIQVVEAPSAIDSASYFKAGQVDAAVVWTPDDADCVSTVPGAKVLTSTKEASYIISDVFFAKESFINDNEKMLVKFLEGWFIGASEINTSLKAKEKASRILSENFENVSYEVARASIDKVRITTYGDNLDFFDLNPDYNGVTGNDLYTKMSSIYKQLGYAQKPPSWKGVIDTSILKKVKLNGAGHESEGDVKFSKLSNSEGTTREAFSSKKVSITYPTGSSALTEEAQDIIRSEFLATAREFARARIRIEGNTDSVGDPVFNQSLSEKRARSVANYLIKTYKFDPNRFIVVGNGENKPVADNSSEEGKSRNRRTDFELLEN